MLHLCAFKLPVMSGEALKYPLKCIKIFRGASPPWTLHQGAAPGPRRGLGGPLTLAYTISAPPAMTSLDPPLVIHQNDVGQLILGMQKHLINAN